MKIAVIFGTRPEAIKLAPIIRTLRLDPRFECTICITAQHRQMLDQVLDVFNIVPDIDLNLMQPNQDLPSLTSLAISAVSSYLKASRPDLVLVQGDTTTVFCASLAAFYQDIPVGHVEAGLRTGNLKSPWPEEGNRVLTSRLATLHFAPTEVGKRNLLREGIPEERIFVTGNTVIDALYLTVQMIEENPPTVPGLDPSLMNGSAKDPLVLITGHRRENFGNRLRSVCCAIAELAVRFPDTQFIYPVHLNPRVRETVWEVLGDGSGQSHFVNVHLISPLTYVPFVALMRRSTVILTDSGGIQEEAPALGKPVLVLRGTTERPEALACGTVKLIGTETGKIITETSRLLRDPDYLRSMSTVHSPYGDGRAAERIVGSIASYLVAPSAQTPSMECATEPFAM
jgi:UDP-N-acetylglucosamine 2-epimerase (non-hydrolysing)